MLLLDAYISIVKMLLDVGHAEDLLYLFPSSIANFPYSDPEVEFTTNRYVRLMTNFVKYG